MIGPVVVVLALKPHQTIHENRKTLYLIPTFFRTTGSTRIRTIKWKRKEDNHFPAINQSREKLENF